MPRPTAAICWVLLSAGLLAGCERHEVVRQAPGDSTPVQPRVSGAAEEILPLAPPAALEKAAAVLSSRGFVIAPALSPTAPLEASSGGPTAAEWASCPTITVRDPFAEAFRARRTGASDFDTRVTVTATAIDPARTRLAIRTLSIGNYQNSYIGTAEQASCRSTGVLERELLDAVRGT